MEDVNWILKDYQMLVFRRFERSGDCNKTSVDGERRCLHHVISPLSYDDQTHLQDFLHLRDVYAREVSYLVFFFALVRL